MLKLSQIIITRDGQRFMVVLAPNGDKGLLDLSNYQVRCVDDIEDYIRVYNFGILTISDSLILSR